MWDAELNKRYQKKLAWFDSTIKYYQPSDTEFDIYQTGKKSLREAQRIWVRYRDEACGAIAGEYGLGNGVTNAIRLCLTKITAQRADMLGN